MPREQELLPAESPDESPPTRGGAVLAIVGVLVSCVYLANLTFGVFEIPDNLPFIGNLDEVFFSGVLFASLHRLGIRVLPNMRGKGRP